MRGKNLLAVMLHCSNAAGNKTASAAFAAFASQKGFGGFRRNIYVEMAEGAILKRGIQVPLEILPKVFYSCKSI